ncbi:MAG: MerR family transcriptional regulator [candidate division Zixibacteria bacterium]|nr:MerR family transcriptional regulator [candidate division Zixibacteria bacterium]
MTKIATEDKRFYSISDVAKITGLEAYVLRFWEKEFPTLKPRKNRGGSRLYTAHDIELINRINHLRKTEKLTIDGTRAKLMLKRSSEESTEISSKARVRTLIGKVRKDVADLLKLFP